MEVGLERIKIPLRDGVELEVEFTELLREQIRSFYSLSKADFSSRARNE